MKKNLSLLLLVAGITSRIYPVFAIEPPPLRPQHPNPPDSILIYIDGNNLLCPGESALLISSVGAGNQWLKNNQPVPGATGPTLRVSTEGVFRVQVTDPQSTLPLLSEPVSIAVAPSPGFDFDAVPRTAAPGEPIRFGVSGPSIPASLAWDFGDDNAAGSSLSEPVYSYSAPGLFSIALVFTDEYGCRDTLVKQGFVTVANSIEPEQFIPTAFTPNGDGANDVFLVRGPMLSDFSMAIFTEWGESVHFSSDQLRGWDGMYNASPAPNGTYVYLIHYRSADGIGRQVSGHITLIR